MRDGITKYINNWNGRNGWRPASKDPVKNQDLWQRPRCRARHSHRALALVKGHSGDEFNERADELVHEARRTQQAWQVGP